MKRLQRQLVLNKAEDWRAAYCWGVVPEGDSLTLAPGARRGVICLWGLDSGEKGFSWGRVSLDCRLAQDSLIRTRPMRRMWLPMGIIPPWKRILPALPPVPRRRKRPWRPCLYPQGRAMIFTSTKAAAICG